MDIQIAALIAASCVLGVWLVLKRFSFVLLCLIVLIPIMRFPFVSGYIVFIKPGVFAAVFLIWFFKDGYRRFNSLARNPLTVFFAGFTVLMLTTMSGSINPASTGIAVFEHLVAFGYFYLFFDVLLKDRSYMRKAAYIFMLTGVFCGLIAVFQYLVFQYHLFPGFGALFLPYVQRLQLPSQPAAVTALMGYRSMGPFTHPNLLALYLSMTLVFDIVFLFIIKDKFGRVLLAVYLFVILAGIFFSGSRGAVVSALVSLMCLFFIFRKQVPKFVPFLGIVLAIGLAFFFRESLGKYMRLENILSNRNFIWSNSLAVAEENLFSGTGLGTFDTIYVQRYGLPSLTDFYNSLADVTLTGGELGWLKGFSAHNVFLLYWGEMGILALILIILFYFLFFSQAVKVVRSKSSIDPGDYALAAGCISVVAGSFVYGFFENSVNFYTFSIAMGFVFIVAIPIAVLSRAGQSPNVSYESH